jgi:hypothetical protein
MSDIDLTMENDRRRNRFEEGYDSNARMVAFIGSWKNVTKQEGNNTWSHLGVYCRKHFGKGLKKQERRLVYLGMLVAFVNGDRCAHWTDEERERALQIAWDFIDSKR